MNKSEEELFCVTRHMEALKSSLSNVEKDSKEYYEIKKDIEECEAIIKDIKSQFKL